MSDTEHQHQGDGADACLITKAEAAGIAGVTERTVELWVEKDVLRKYATGATGYWVRFCRHEVVALDVVRPAGGPNSGALDGVSIGASAVRT